MTSDYIRLNRVETKHIVDFVCKHELDVFSYVMAKPALQNLIIECKESCYPQNDMECRFKYIADSVSVPNRRELEMKYPRFSVLDEVDKSCKSIYFAEWKWNYKGTICTGRAFLCDINSSIVFFPIDSSALKNAISMDMLYKSCGFWVAMFVGTQHLLLNNWDYFNVSEQRVSRKPKHTTHKQPGRKYTPQKVRIYRISRPIDFDDIKIPYVSRYEMNCPAWGVRGHYRHCKSGKVIYVKPHIKGQYKDQYTGREYVLFPKNSKEVL